MLPILEDHISGYHFGSQGPTVLDLFSGAGGTSLGFRESGFKLVGAIERDESAALTYKNNFGSPIHCDDVRNVSPKQLLKEIGLVRGELSVLIGCPPCQGFSEMRNDKGSADVRNELLLSMLDYVKFLRPKYLFMENVPGLLKTSYGSRLYNHLVSGLKALSYGVHAKIVNAADYGVPQNRRRVIILAGRDGGLPPFPWAEYDYPSSTSVKHGFRKRWRTVRDAIANYPQTPTNQGGPDFANHEAANLGERVQKFIEAVPKDGGSRNQVPVELWLECHLNHSGHNDVYSRLSWDSPSNTITTGCSNPSKGRFTHPDLNRAITLREAAALQGFPDSFIFSGTNIARQIGNAVPPPLARAFATALRISDAAEIPHTTPVIK